MSAWPFAVLPVLLLKDGAGVVEALVELQDDSSVPVNKIRRKKLIKKRVRLLIRTSLLGLNYQA